MAKKKAKAASKKTKKQKSAPQTRIGTKKKTTKKAATNKAAHPKPNPTKAQSQSSTSEHASFPIVGIGSSAGGLEALQVFFKSMPADTGLAFVVVSHLDPKHRSLMPEILQTCTRMKVAQARDGMRVLPNSVCLIPPNKDMIIMKGVLQLLEPTESIGPRQAIDTFLKALAADQKENAVCIILSGAGSDGSLGLREIRREAGMVMVQDPESAKFDGMPRAAVATGLADYVLSPEAMPKQLVAYTRLKTCRIGVLPIDDDSSFQESLQKIYALLRSHTGHDFSTYKLNTIRRRIERRLYVHQIEDVSVYVRYLRETPDEIHALFRELLIGVTNFFRDPETWDLLRDTALTDLLKSKPQGSTVRVWVPGCSTGEEAYSVAMLFHECMDHLNRNLNLQVFGTDIDEKAIEVARRGTFPESVSADLGEERLRRFFTREGGSCVVKKDLRSHLTFACQNIVKDPPFTKLDLLCCRNLLIYLDAQTQKKLLSHFHYSLVPGGVLLLGSSETIGSGVDLFSTVDQKHKIFRKKESPAVAQSLMSFPVPPRATGTDSPLPGTIVTQDIKPETFERAERCLLERYAPSCVIVTEKGEIVYIVRGQTSPYLDLAPGRAQLNILDMAKRPLRSKLTAALYNATTTKQSVVYKRLRLKEENRTHVFDLIVEPILEAESPPGLLIVIFEKAVPTEEPPRQQRGKNRTATAARVAALEAELQAVKEDLQTSMEVMKSANEELKSTNEELQSTNEELQSSNEELETSKEEMQSLNEELTTVNAENESRIKQLTNAHDDMRNLLDSTPLATIFVDTRMNIKRFTPKATAIVSLIDSDIGRPLAHFVNNLRHDDLHADVEGVISSLQPVVKEVQDNCDKSYTMRISPYRTSSNVIEGAVITFDEITARRQAEIRLTESETRYAAVLKTSTEMISLVNRDGNFIHTNPAWARVFGKTHPEHSNLFEIIHPDDRIRIRDVWHQMINDRTETREMSGRHKLPNGEYLFLSFSATLLSVEGQPHLLIVTRNISEERPPRKSGERGKE